MSNDNDVIPNIFARNFAIILLLLFSIPVLWFCAWGWNIWGCVGSLVAFIIILIIDILLLIFTIRKIIQKRKKTKRIGTDT